jgi:hypothetical protein
MEKTKKALMESLNWRVTEKMVCVTIGVWKKCDNDDVGLIDYRNAFESGNVKP